MENLGVSNILIVEGKSDKVFIEAFIQHLQLTFTVGEAVNECKDLDGITNLRRKLKGLKSEIEKNGIEKIGIIFDADDVGVEKRTEEIETEINSILKDESHIFSIYIMNVDGKGELETILRKISSEDSTMADCLEKWQECLKSKNKEITQKELAKLWVQVYQRYDCCTKKESEQANKNCNDKASFEKNIWNFEDETLKELKEFLEKLSK